MYFENETGQESNVYCSTEAQILSPASNNSIQQNRFELSRSSELGLIPYQHSTQFSGQGSCNAISKGWHSLCFNHIHSCRWVQHRGERSSVASLVFQILYRDSEKRNESHRLTRRWRRL